MTEQTRQTFRFRSEEALIEFLRTHRRASRIGDDAAFLPLSELAVTMDTQLEGRHFRTGLPADKLARRALAVNLSDLAAVGAEPRFLFLALVAPTQFDFKQFFETILAECETHSQLELSGGDLTSGPTISVTITLAGERRSASGWLRRDTARAGQSLWVGGSIGEAALGLAIIERYGFPTEIEKLPLPADFRDSAARAVARHVEPSAQLELGAWLADLGSKPATIDISDGLAKDLHRLCRASDVGACVELDKLPMPTASKELCEALGIDWQRLALAGGEDYVLLFSLEPEIQPPAWSGAIQIGRTTPRRSSEPVELFGPQGRQPLGADGWDHLADS